MPRYYFHLRHPRKRVMVISRDAAAAREQAEVTVRDFVRPALNVIEAGWEACSVEARDARVCLIVDIAIADAALRWAEATLQPIVLPTPARVVHLDLEGPGASSPRPDARRASCCSARIGSWSSSAPRRRASPPGCAC